MSVLRSALCAFLEPASSVSEELMTHSCGVASVGVNPVAGTTPFNGGADEVFAVLICAVLFALPVTAEEVEMELKEAHGLTEREYHLSGPDASMMQCVFQAIIASKFITDNLMGNLDHSKNDRRSASADL